MWLLFVVVVVVVLCVVSVAGCLVGCRLCEVGRVSVVECCVKQMNLILIGSPQEKAQQL